MTDSQIRYVRELEIGLGLIPSDPVEIRRLDPRQSAALILRLKAQTSARSRQKSKDLKIIAKIEALSEDF